jgi:glycosyltransferase involved in cell wall biosynthesis
MTTEMTIGLRPFVAKQNSYIQRNREILARIGPVVEVPPPLALLGKVLRRLCTFKSPRMFDVAIIHWREDVIVLGRNTPALRGIVAYFLSMFLYRIASRRVVYVRHNRYPHKVLPRYQDRVRRLIGKGQSLCHAVVTHSPSYADEYEYTYIPHPLYRLDQVEAIDASDEYVVFGAIAEYKKIRELVEAWGCDRKLLIAGPCDDPAYLTELQNLAANKPIQFDVGYQDQNKMAKRLANSNGVIIVNDPGSMIISGTFFFALSVGVPVYVRTNSFYDWVKSTPLGDHVHVFDSVSEVADHTGKAADHRASESGSIQKAALEFFGDDAVLYAWQSLFTQIDAQATSVTEKSNVRES